MDPNFVNDFKQKMIKVLDVLKGDLATVRTGRAAPSLVENLVISVYAGSAKMKIMELATVVASDPQTLVITPFDKSILEEIQKGLMEANTGLTPSNDGNVIRISIPPLTQERRDQLIKLMHQKLENGRIMVRQVRHDAMQEVKKHENESGISEDEVTRIEKEVQNLTDTSIGDIDGMGKKKEEELQQL